MNREERRKNIRVIFRTSVSIAEAGDNGRIIESEDTRDISLKGIYVLASSPLPAGTQCNVILRLSGSSSELSLMIDGEVVRNDSEGMAIRFRQMDIDALIHLKNILYYNSGDTDRVDAELAGTAV